MSREEEIKQAAKIFHASSDDYTVYNKGFEVGAEWSDQNPRKGLWDAEKVIKWLQDNADSYTWYDEFEGESGMTDNFIEDLRKAMED